MKYIVLRSRRGGRWVRQFGWPRKKKILVGEESVRIWSGRERAADSRSFRGVMPSSAANLQGQRGKEVSGFFHVLASLRMLTA